MYATTKMTDHNYGFIQDLNHEYGSQAARKIHRIYSTIGGETDTTSPLTA